MKGQKMQKLKKAFYFLLGFLFIPEILSELTALILNLYNSRLLVGYYALVFLIIYFAFPFLYRKDIPKHFPNRYAFYGILYLIFWIFGIILALYITE